MWKVIFLVLILILVATPLFALTIEEQARTDLKTFLYAEFPSLDNIQKLDPNKVDAYIDAVTMDKNLMKKVLKMWILYIQASGGLENMLNQPLGK